MRLFCSFSAAVVSARVISAARAASRRTSASPGTAGRGSSRSRSAKTRTRRSSSSPSREMDSFSTTDPSGNSWRTRCVFRLVVCFWQTGLMMMSRLWWCFGQLQRRADRVQFIISKSFLQCCETYIEHNCVQKTFWETAVMTSHRCGIPRSPTTD